MSKKTLFYPIDLHVSKTVYYNFNVGNEGSLPHK